VILDFDDSCWESADVEWQRSLIELLMLVKRHDLHSVLAAPSRMIPWCENHIPLFVEYFKARLAAAQPRINALKISVQPAGALSAAGNPPWALSAVATAEVINRPLRLVLENDESDRRFLKSTVQSFSAWCNRGWVEIVMGGGSAMGSKITAAGADVLAGWRTFFIFDSDRLHPNELAAGWAPPGGDSCQGHQFENLCAAIPRGRWHCLERRSIENYLPDAVLHPRQSGLTAILFDNSVGKMAYFYNMKLGLKGDGISPAHANKLARAGRSQGFWTALPQEYVSTLEEGFGSNVADEFDKVPANHPWQASIVSEMSMLADALQDAM
jgi:hypothetical protein